MLLFRYLFTYHLKCGLYTIFYNYWGYFQILNKYSFFIFGSSLEPMAKILTPSLTLTLFIFPNGLVSLGFYNKIL